MPKTSPTEWAGLDSNQRKLSLTGLQPVPKKSQAIENKELTDTQKHHLQTSLQTKPEYSTKSATNQTQNLSDDLAEIVAAWPSLPDHIKAAIKSLIKTA